MSSNWAGKSITYENQPGTNLKTIFKIHGLEGMAVAACSSFNIPCEFINQATWRASFLGNGRPKNAKQEAKKQCERLGIKTTTLDTAEAAGIVWCLNQRMNPYTHRRANDLFSGKQSISVQEYRAEAEKLFK
jgi:hypothetical protein